MSFSTNAWSTLQTAGTQSIWYADVAGACRQCDDSHWQWLTEVAERHMPVAKFSRYGSEENRGECHAWTLDSCNNQCFVDWKTIGVWLWKIDRSGFVFTNNNAVFKKLKIGDPLKRFLADFWEQKDSEHMVGLTWQRKMQFSCVKSPFRCLSSELCWLTPPCHQFFTLLLFLYKEVTGNLEHKWPMWMVMEERKRTKGRFCFPLTSMSWTLHQQERVTVRKPKQSEGNWKPTVPLLLPNAYESWCLG